MSDHEPRIGEPGAQRDADWAGTRSDNDPTLAQGAGAGYGSMPDSGDAGDQMLGSPKGGAESGAADTGPGRYGGADSEAAGRGDDPYSAGAFQSGTEHPSAVRTGSGETPSTDRADVMSAAQTRDAEHFGQHHHEGHHSHHPTAQEGYSAESGAGEWAGQQAQGQYDAGSGPGQPDYSRAEDWRQQHPGGGEVH